MALRFVRLIVRSDASDERFLPTNGYRDLSVNLDSFFVCFAG
jgi:hypothetical protein